MNNTCKVCSDKASGIHYGILSCEGCKGFFKRSLSLNSTFKCLLNSNCPINKKTRYRCKYCRFQKCILAGMSVDGIKLGRKPKSEKLFETNGEIQLSKTSKNESEQSVYFSEEFKRWLHLKVEYVRNKNLNEATSLSSCFNLIEISQTNYESYNILKDYQLFSTSSSDNNSLLLSRVLNQDQDLLKITLLRDKVFQVYKKHIKNSLIINNSYERLKNNDYVSSKEENLSMDTFLEGVAQIISVYSKWLTRFAKELPGFGDLDEDDFKKILLSAFMPTIALQMNEFYLESNTIFITPNGIQMDKTRMDNAFGVFNSNLSFIIHSILKELNLTEKERSLFYPFILTNVNFSNLKRKKDLERLKFFYNKAFMYELSLSERDVTFFQKFNQFMEYISVIDMNQEINT